MDSKPNSSVPPKGRDFASYLDRRNFLRSGSAVGGGLLLTSKSAIAQQKEGDLKVAIAGCGAQGETLMESMKMIDGGFQVTAVCDIRVPKQKEMAGRLRGNSMGTPEMYTDFEEMIDAEKAKGLDAVFIATPDFMHSPHAVYALDAGLAVYCEKMMSNTIEGAREMVKAGARSSRPFQIGHQRRSNPRYLNLVNNIINKEQLLGRITHAYAQWNRAVTARTEWGGEKREGIDEATLQKYGFEDGEQFKNWRWYKKYGAGPISDLGAHQIDLFNWFFGGKPKSVIGTGGIDYYEDSELEDNVMAIYEYEYPKGKTARAYYQVLTTTGSQGAYEKWMGTDGSALMSELPDSGNQLYKEGRSTKDWGPMAAKGWVKQSASNIYHKFWEHPKDWDGPHKQPTPWLATENVADARISKGLEAWELGVNLGVRPHTPHIEAFFEAVRKDDPGLVNCTVQEAFETCVTVLTINESIKAGRKIEFQDSDFVA